MRRRNVAVAVSLVSLLSVAVWTGAQTAGAAEQGAASCGANLKDQSKAVGKEPTPDEQGRVFPLVTIHGITGSNADFEGVVDLSYRGYTPSESRTLIENLTGKPGASKVKGFPHVRVYSYEYTKDSLRWVTDPAVGEAFGKVIDCLYEHHGVPVSVLAHSMGGLATRWVANSTDPNGQPRAPKLGKVVTLGTPYTGSAIAAGSGGAVDVAAVFSPPVAALVIYCGWRGTNSGIGNCGPIPVLQSGTSEAGRALRQGSDELSRLSRWPSEVDVTAFAGSMVLSAKLFNASVGSVEIGDGVVGVDSASADADTTPVYECRYEQSLTPAWDALKELLKIRKPEERWAELGNLLLSQPCYHGNLMRNWEMLLEVVGVFADWFAAQSVEPAAYMVDYRGPDFESAVPVVLKVKPDGTVTELWREDAGTKLDLIDVSADGKRIVAQRSYCPDGEAVYCGRFERNLLDGTENPDPGTTLPWEGLKPASPIVDAANALSVNGAWVAVQLPDGVGAVIGGSPLVLIKPNYQGGPLPDHPEAYLDLGNTGVYCESTASSGSDSVIAQCLDPVTRSLVTDVSPDYPDADLLRSGCCIQLWEVPLDGGAPTQLTRITYTAEDAVVIFAPARLHVDSSGGRWVQFYGDCGARAVRQLLPDGQFGPVSAAGEFVGVAGRRLITVDSWNCSGFGRSRILARDFDSDSSITLYDSDAGDNADEGGVSVSGVLWLPKR